MLGYWVATPATGREVVASKRRVWLRPELRIEVRALPQPSGTMLRHATFVRAL
jgi:hypothetical protein